MVSTLASCLHIGNTIHCNRPSPTRRNLEDQQLSGARPGRKRFSLSRGVLFAAVALVCASLAQSAQFSVDAVKAAYLFRFAQYVEWPALPADASFVIAVSGAEDVAAHLE